MVASVGMAEGPCHLHIPGLLLLARMPRQTADLAGVASTSLLAI